MGVILWGESPLYLVPVTFNTRQYTKCNSYERQYEARATAHKVTNRGEEACGCARKDGSGLRNVRFDEN
ncbi:hypothetical protein Pla52n_67270 [Stieleria varia]|uniref:Uncharacterized protein n=1 Tax=Stieleria varia TaxID=2528005 RepID=A0A5C5ZQQ5_9BACT|nr:hypothetical protein Pla52n_67270 [Stieleria varia]